LEAEVVEAEVVEAEVVDEIAASTSLVEIKSDVKEGGRKV